MALLHKMAARIPHLTIRQKVVTGVVIPVLLFTARGFVSCNCLVRLAASLKLMEAAGDLANTILGIRRYEKNYLLYAHIEDYDEAQQYIDEAQK